MSSPASAPASPQALANMFDDPASPYKAASPARTASSRSPTPNRQPRDTDDENEADQDQDGDQKERLEYADDPAEEEILEGNIVLPRVPKLASSDGMTWVLKLPSAISFPKEPFHPDLYTSDAIPQQAVEDEEDTTLELQRARALNRMHEIANTVRWKWVPGEGGVMVRKSNARIIRWSDGTASLMVGQEMWDCLVDNIAAGSTTSNAKPFALSSLLSENGTQTPATVPTNTRDGPLSILFSTEYDDKVLVADSLITGSLSLIPQTLNVRNHPKRLAAVTKATTKKARIQSYNDNSGVRPDRLIEDQVREMQETQKKRLKARGYDLNALVSQPVWKGGNGGSVGRDREGSPQGKKRPGKGRASYSSDEEMDERPAGGYGGGDYESDDFVVDDEDAPSPTRTNHTLSDLDLSPKRTKSKPSRDYASSSSSSELDIAEREAEKVVQKEKREKRKREKDVVDPDEDDEAAMDIVDEEPLEQTVIQKRVLQYDDEEDDL